MFTVFPTATGGRVDKKRECWYNKNMNENTRYVYWNPTTHAVYGSFQLRHRTEEERSQLIKIDESLWNEILDQINSHDKMLSTDPETQLPIAVDKPEPTDAEKAETEITSLKMYLNESDWKAIKASELGVPLSELYPDDSTKRSEARAKINELEKLLT